MLTLAASTTSGHSIDVDALRRLLEAQRFDDRYRGHVLIDRPGCWLARTTYDGYPLASFETRDALLVLEGCLYGAPALDLRAALSCLVPMLFDDVPRRRVALGRWLLGTDGPFVLFAWHKHWRQWALLNDALGRLPLYTYTDAGTFLCSRLPGVFLHLPLGARAEPPAVDRLGLAQQLVHGFPLGERTLLEGVRRMPPATLLRGGPGGTVRHRVLHTFNFEHRRHAARSTAENARRLADLLDEATARRARMGGANVLALSGGLDSRAVALSLQRSGAPFEAVTFLRDDEANAADADAAAEVALRFGLTHRTLALAPVTRAHYQRLLDAHSGLNTFDVAYVVDFLDRLLVTHGHDARSGPFQLFTGDIGFPFRPLVPAATGGMPAYLQARPVVPYELAHRLTGVAAADLHEAAAARAASYPETDPAQRFVHFCVYDWLYKTSYVGEDRNRRYAWTQAPLYALPVFRHVMQIPDAQKAHHALYRSLLQRLHPDALEVGYPDYMGLRMTPLRIRTYTALRELTAYLPPLRRALEHWQGRHAAYGPDDLPVTLMREKLDAHPAIGDVLDPRVLRALLDDPSPYPTRVVDQLTTLTAFLVARAGPAASSQAG